MGRTPASVKVRAVWNGFRKSPAYKYTLKGYYDQSGSAGGRVRIVIATR